MCDPSRHGRARAVRILIVELPERLPLQFPAMAGGAGAHIDGLPIIELLLVWFHRHTVDCQ